MRKFFVSACYLLILATIGLSVAVAELPKTAELPDGQEIAIPDISGKTLMGTCETFLAPDRKELQEFCQLGGVRIESGVVLTENSTLVLGFAVYGSTTTSDDGKIVTTREEIAFTYDVSGKPINMFLSGEEGSAGFYVLVSEDGSAAAYSEETARWGERILRDADGLITGMMFDIVGEGRLVLDERTIYF